MLWSAARHAPQNLGGVAWKDFFGGRPKNKGVFGLRTVIFSLLFVMLGVLPVAVAQETAQELGGKKVSEVRFEGLERISDQTARAQLEVQPGLEFNPRVIARDIRRLYDQGFFSHVRADAQPSADGVVVTYIVEEKRVIEQIRIIGNDKIRERRVRGVLQMSEGQSFIAEAFDEERKSVLDLYESKGFANTRVDITAEKIGPSRVRVVYNIQEGRKAKIKHIEVEGNEVLSDREVRKIMKTRKARWFLGGKFDEAKFEADLKTVLDEYGNIGRLEADITGTDMTYSPNGKKMNLTVRVAEGPEYKVNTVDVARNVVFDADELEEPIEVVDGEVHDKGQVAADAEEMAKQYQDSGYVNARVTPQVTLDKENKTTTVVHNVQEGDLKYIRKVDVAGNEMTKDEVVRRSVRLMPGDRFDGTELKNSQRRLDGTGYFERVNLSLEDVTEDLRYTDLNVDVAEDKAGAFSFGAGFSTEDGVGGFGELRLNNFDISNPWTFRGGGQDFSIRANLGSKRDEFSLAWTDPQILGYPLSFGVDAFNESYQVTGGQDYRQENTGGQLRFAKVLSEYNMLRVGFRGENINNEDFPFVLNRELRDQEGSSTTLSTTWQLERNKLDKLRDPSRGGKHIFSLTVAGLADNEFVKVEHDSTWYRPLDGDKQKWVMSWRTREGYALPFGDDDDLRLEHRYYAGGTTTVRGYENRGVGPKERENIWFGKRFSLGGELRYVSNFEIKYKAADLLRLYAFWDAGGVWEEPSDFDASEIRHGVGLGIGFDVPKFGPVRLDYGFRLNPDESQSTGGKLHLTSGFRF